MNHSAFLSSLKRSCLQLARRPIYMLMMVVAPLACTWFLLDLISPGVVCSTPVGVVDDDNSELSRALTRNLGAMQQVEITHHFRSFSEAREAVQRGDVLGFFYIPAHMSEDALDGQQPTLSYYINYAYYTPASNQYKGFMTTTVLANGAIVQTAMRTVGLPDQVISATLQPYSSHTHPLSNPWLNYSYYLNMSFIPCLFSLFILLITVYSIGMEWKHATTLKWLDTARGSIVTAVMGKLLPQTLLFTAVGWTIQMMMFRLYGLPMNGSVTAMMAAMFLLVIANQGFALTAFCIVPALRYAITLCTLLGMLSFSLGAFSLPEEAMYSWIQPLSWVTPIKYYFLISVDQALNGIPLYYSRFYFVALIAFALSPALFLWRLKREALKPVYVP